MRETIFYSKNALFFKRERKFRHYSLLVKACAENWLITAKRPLPGERIPPATVLAAQIHPLT
jgi:hypothetical protein